jgi:hypothetical protein
MPDGMERLWVLAQRGAGWLLADALLRMRGAHRWWLSDGRQALAASVVPQRMVAIGTASAAVVGLAAAGMLLIDGAPSYRVDELRPEPSIGLTAPASPAPLVPELAPEFASLIE